MAGQLYHYQMMKIVVLIRYSVFYCVRNSSPKYSNVVKNCYERIIKLTTLEILKANKIKLTM